MPETPPVGSVEREYSQLIQLHARLVERIEEMCDELDAPATTDLLASIREAAGSDAPEKVGEVRGALQEAIRLLKLFGSQLEQEITAPDEEIRRNLVAGLPPPLARFLAERRRAPDCEITVEHDAVRGWVIRWKEYTEFGTVRGGGQFSERPYAWLEE